MHAIWFRSDLRVHDQPALFYALKVSRESNTPLVALFCASTEQWRSHDMAPCKQFFIKESLHHLQHELIKLRVPLIVLNSPLFSNAAQTIEKWCRSHKITRMFANREYEWNERQRDQQVESQLEKHGIRMSWYEDQCILAPNSVLKPDQSPYSVFTPFSKKWKSVYQSSFHTPLKKPKAQAAFHMNTPPWPKALQKIQPTLANQHWEGGEASAQRALQSFILHSIDHYHTDRDRPDKKMTSLLSPHLSIGTISANQCLHAALSVQQDDAFAGKSGISVWINELIWRDFYRHLLIHYPRLSQHKPFKPETDAIKWHSSSSDFDAWCQGKTGFPLVDAAMRQLISTGWMHNRLRMVTAMFLTKHLLIDWRKGEKWFMEHLVDGDLASNNGGWQWSASTGVDAVPYFRVFNPITQSKKFDPDGEFIRSFVTELSNVSTPEIHEPHASTRSQMGYPQPIVNLKLGRERAIEAFKHL